MKIVLISLYNPSSFEIRGFHSLLKQKNYEVHSIFLKDLKSTNLRLPTKKEYKLLTDKTKAEKPDLIAIAVRSSFFKIAGKITKNLKHLGVPILWGGIHVTLCPDECIKKTDIICLGEGEEALLELCERIDKKQAYSNTKNLWVNKNGKITKNPVRPLTQNLDEFPFPHFTDEETTFIEDDLIYPGGYSSLNPHAKEEIMVLSGRWCPYSCTYCCNSYLHKLYPGRIDRRRSAGNVIENLVKLKKQGVKSFFFIDEVFSKDKKWIDEFCPKYKKAVNLPFKCLYHPTDFDSEKIKLLSDAGLCFVGMGIQSGSEKTRKELFKRSGTNKQILETMRVLNKHNVKSCLDLILDNPLESFEDKLETVKLFLKIPRGYDINMFSLVYFPNTELTKIALERGIITKNQIDGANSSAIKNWGGGWQSNTNKEDTFINCLIFLIARTNVSKKIIKRLSKSHFLMKHPFVLSTSVNALDYYQINSKKFVNYVRIVKKLIFKRDFSMLNRLVSRKIKN